MRKMRKYNFQRGLAKDLLVAVFFFSLMEILSIFYPIILKNLVTQKVNNDAGVVPEMGDFLISAGIVLGMLVIIFFVSLYARNRVSVYGAKCRRNARNMLYEKMTHVPTNVLYEYGTSKVLSCMIEDTTWVKYCYEQYLFCDYHFGQLCLDYDIITDLRVVYCRGSAFGNCSIVNSPCRNQQTHAIGSQCL